ncbi:cytochrome P460 family protein [Dankookia sp. GCM10030260]|uniref:cytochrome P460 family protein n=1 Tax=Dankookia sp. GCM10030260 TaxID=3273390 RepID=UPI003616BFBC
MLKIPPTLTPFAVVVFASLGGSALFAQDRYSLKVPDGLAFAEFKGYEDWQTIAVSQAGEVMAAILGNPAMIEAYRAGFPGNGKPVPDGAKMAKIHWKTATSAEAPAPTTVPGALKDIDFMVKDSTRFRDSGGWGYAQFNYDPATDRFMPEGTGAACGAACHTLVQAKDYVFTAYPRR